LSKPYHLEEKEKELEALRAENGRMRKELDEVTTKLTLIQETLGM